mmetsp:Transcript_14805/g.46353  ORF Transcript_14805/g.46353 Transcript_14805/m.46353 type:complete len:241 (-) Transcript_14805:1135-1857(-)
MRRGECRSPTCSWCRCWSTRSSSSRPSRCTPSSDRSQSSRPASSPSSSRGCSSCPSPSSTRLATRTRSPRTCRCTASSARSTRAPSAGRAASRSCLAAATPSPRAGGRGGEAAEGEGEGTGREGVPASSRDHHAATGRVESWGPAAAGALQQGTASPRARPDALTQRRGALCYHIHHWRDGVTRRRRRDTSCYGASGAHGRWRGVRPSTRRGRSCLWKAPTCAFLRKWSNQGFVTRAVPQ